MGTPVAGVVRGRSISLERAISELEGRRVRVILEPEESEESADTSLSAEEQARLWRAWANRGPEGPVEA